MLVLPFISFIHHGICSSFGLKCHSSLIQGLINGESAVPEPQTDTKTSCTISVTQWTKGNVCLGKEHESKAGKTNFPPEIHFRSVFQRNFREMWEAAAEGRELLILSFPLFGKSCSKR